MDIQYDIEDKTEYDIQIEISDDKTEDDIQIKISDYKTEDDIQIEISDYKTEDDIQIEISDDLNISLNLVHNIDLETHLNYDFCKLVIKILVTLFLLSIIIYSSSNIHKNNIKQN
jgi:hypothetical protein